MVRAKDLLGLGSESESGFMNQRSGSWSAVNRQGQVQGYGRGQGSGVRGQGSGVRGRVRVFSQRSKLGVRVFRVSGLVSALMLIRVRSASRGSG